MIIALDQKVRIGLNDDVLTIILKMSDGNPGVMSVLTQFIRHTKRIDPADIFEGLGPILFLDTLSIYGPRIWLLFKDVCGQSIIKTVGMLRAVQLGYCSREKLNHAIDNRGQGIDIPALMTQVRERLPDFIKEDDNVLVEAA